VNRRLRALTVAVSLASLPFTLPHVLEDFAEGIAHRVGLSTDVGAFLLGGFLALQSLGLILIGARRRAGWVVTFWVGLVWIVGAFVEHGPALAAGGLGRGPRSLLWLAGLIAIQALAAALAWLGWRRGGRG
jgi:hypothetical protein